MHKFRSKELNKIISFNLDRNFNSFATDDRMALATDVNTIDTVKFIVKLPQDTVSIVMVLTPSGEISKVLPKVYEQGEIDVEVSKSEPFKLYIVSKDYNDGYVTKLDSASLQQLVIDGACESQSPSSTTITISQYMLSTDKVKAHEFNPTTLFDKPTLDLSTATRIKTPNKEDGTQWYPYLGNYSGETLSWEYVKDFDYLEAFFVLLKKRRRLRTLQAAWYYAFPRRVNVITKDSTFKIKINPDEKDDVGNIFDYDLPYRWGGYAREYILSCVEAFDKFGAIYKWYDSLSPTSTTRAELGAIASIPNDTDTFAELTALMPSSWLAHIDKNSYAIMETYAMNLSPTLFRNDDFRGENRESWGISFDDVNGPKCFLYPHDHEDVPRTSSDQNADATKRLAQKTALSRTFITAGDSYTAWAKAAAKPNPAIYEDYTLAGGDNYSNYYKPYIGRAYKSTYSFWVYLHGIPAISSDIESVVGGNTTNSGRYYEAAYQYRRANNFLWGIVEPLSQDILDLNDMPFVDYSNLMPDSPAFAWTLFWQKARDFAIRSLEIRQVLDRAIANIDDEYRVFQTELMTRADDCEV